EPTPPGHRLSASHHAAMQFAWAALLLVAAASGTRVARRNAPDVDAKVAAEARENIQIHDGFLSQEKKDEKDESEVRHNKDRAERGGPEQQRQVGRRSRPRPEDADAGAGGGSPPRLQGSTDPCGSITCAASLVCPGTFKVESLPGHCCPYCVNPDVKLESAVTGATGSSGGKASVFCENVWCFPTMCTKALSEPSTTNGQCCAACPAL
ncbi:unnamed protein product, partial [Prorocentrum cordatum]